MANHLEFATNLCLECGKLIAEGFYKDKSIRAKDIADFVTEYDVMVEKLVQDRISVTYPSYRFIGEENAASGQSYELTTEPTWIVDPIDGTNNFIAKFPFCCISLALYIDKQCAVAVIFNPILDKLYTAAKGQGAFLNNDRIRVCPPKDLNSSLVITGWGSDRNELHVAIKANNKKSILEHCRGLRSVGSAAISMCMVANGQADIYLEQGISCWDMAAGCLIVTEAGGVVANPDGIARYIMSCLDESVLPGSSFDLMTHGVLCASHQSHIDRIASLINVIDY